MNALCRYVQLRFSPPPPPPYLLEPVVTVLNTIQVGGRGGPGGAAANGEAEGPASRIHILPAGGRFTLSGGRSTRKTNA